MDQVISAADANRKFSDLLRGIRSGGSYVITSHGKPVARVIPYAPDDQTQRAARDRLLARLDAQPASTIGAWDRNEIYER